jgi:hypothetical protein
MLQNLDTSCTSMHCVAGLMYATSSGLYRPCRRTHTHTRSVRMVRRGQQDRRGERCMTSRQREGAKAYRAQERAEETQSDGALAYGCAITGHENHLWPRELLRGCIRYRRLHVFYFSLKACLSIRLVQVLR